MTVPGRSPFLRSRDLEPRLPQSDFDIAPGISTFASGDLRPEGSGAGQAPDKVIDVGLFESMPAACETETRIFFPGNTCELENYSPSGEAADKNPGSGPGIDTENTFGHLSGSALSGAFSKVLMKSNLPAVEKVRILTEVTSVADPALKDRVRREWLVKLSVLCKIVTEFAVLGTYV